MAFRAAGETDRHIFELDTAERERLWQEISAFIKAVKEHSFAPYCLKSEGKPVDFSYFPVTQYGSAMVLQRYESFCRRWTIFMRRGSGWNGPGSAART